MPSKDFAPPKYVETHHYVFDRRSGEIVATETRWSIARRKGRVETKVQPELLDSLALQIGKNRRALDVLVVKKPPKNALARRVDVRQRKLIWERIPFESVEKGKPGRLRAP